MNIVLSGRNLYTDCSRCAVIRVGFAALCILVGGCSTEDNITAIDKNLVPSSVNFQLNSIDHVLFTQDDGLLIAGAYNNRSTIIKTNYKFNINWTKNNYEWGNLVSGSGWGSSFYGIRIVRMFQKNDGTYVCIGTVTEGSDVIFSSTLVITLNQQGEQIRSYEFNNTGTLNALQTNDGGFLLFGNKLIKLDKDFNQQWEKDLYNYTYYQNQIVSTTDGGFATTGSYNYDQVFLEKMDADGNEISGVTYKHNDFPFNEFGSDLIQLQDNGFLIVGAARNLNQPMDRDFQIIKTTFSGDTLWTKRFGNSAEDRLDRFISFEEDEFVIKGEVDYPDESHKSILIKINSDGQLLDSIRTEKFQMMLYSPLKFYIKVQNKDQNHINFTKIESDNLFR